MTLRLFPVLLMLASLFALTLMHRASTTFGDGRSVSVDAPAVNDVVLKLRLFYVGLAIAAIAGLLFRGDGPLYLVLALIFSGTPILGHQTVGITPCRRDRPYRLLWRLGIAYPVLVLGLAAAMIAERLQ